MNNAELTINGIKKTVTPFGLTGLKINIEKETDQQFLRQKTSLTAQFSDADYQYLKSLQGTCCTPVFLSVGKDCGQVPAGVETELVKLKSDVSKIEWDFGSCTATIKDFKIVDTYVGVYKYWERKANMLNMPANVTIVHNYKKKESQRTIGGDVQYSHPVINNNRFRDFNPWVLFAIQQAFLGTEVASIIPDSVAQMSSFFTMPINICTGKPNLFPQLAVAQNSDVLYPTSTQPATGFKELQGYTGNQVTIQQSASINQDVAVSLKQLLESLKALFDVDWFIDSSTGKFRIEHSSYFSNGGTYGTPQVGIDLTLPKYDKDFKFYKGNYKYQYENIVGIEELIIPQNESVNNSNFAVPHPVPAFNPNITVIDQYYLQCNDFSFGNIKYENDCVTLDDKGQPAKNTKTCELFITHFEAFNVSDESIDKNKWCLVQRDTDYPGPGNVYSIVFTIPLRTRIPRAIVNGNLSATSLMVSFHRWNKYFDKAYMNYNQDAPRNTDVYRGTIYQMQSIKRTKLMADAVIDFCCEDTFDFTKLIKFRDGKMGTLLGGGLQLSNNSLTLKVLVDSDCIITNQYPDIIDITQCGNYGDFIKRVYMGIISIDTRAGASDGETNYQDRYQYDNYYANGNCGEYIVSEFNENLDE